MLVPNRLAGRVMLYPWYFKKNRADALDLRHPRLLLNLGFIYVLHHKFIDIYCLS